MMKMTVSAEPFPKLARLRLASKWLGAAGLVLIPSWFFAWWVCGVRVWSSHHLDMGAAFFLSLIWLPLAVATSAVSAMQLRAEAEALREAGEALAGSVASVIGSIREEFEARTGQPWPHDDERPRSVH